MKIEGLVKRIREEFLHDASGTSEKHFRWKTPHIVSSLSLAEKELCRKLFLLADSTTPEICQIAVSAVNGVFQRSYAISETILRVERLKFPGVIQPLVRTTSDWLDQHDSGWDEAKGTPTHFVSDCDNYTLTFNRQPVSGGTATMTVKRLPKVSILDKADSEAPEVKQLDDEMIHGALKYLYLKPDLEGYDPGLAAKWEKQFEADIKQIVLNQAAMNPREYVCKPERF